MKTNWHLTTQKSINLGPMFSEPNDKKYVRFDSLHFGSFLNIKARGLGTKDEYYTSLLQITLRNEIYVFDLDTVDDKKPVEINYVNGIDQLIDQQNFVNIGMKDQIVVLDKKTKIPRTALLHTNEDASIYFMEIKINNKGSFGFSKKPRKSWLKKLTS